MTIDWSVSLGNILVALSWVGALMVFFSKMAFRVDRVEQKVNLLWQWFMSEHKLGGGSEQE